MNKNTITKKKAILMLACVWFIISFSVIQTTYAKYVTNFDTNANITISYWNILVNTRNISQNSDITSAITPVFPGDEFSEANVIVPGSTGYFDLSIDSTNVNTDFSVTVTASINENSDLTYDFAISGYSFDNGANITSLSNTSSFSANIIAAINTTTIRVYTTWTDDGLDSTEDTALGISGGDAILDVTLTFNQTV